MSISEMNPEERKKLVILSSLLAIIVLIGTVYFVFLSGGESSDQDLTQQSSTGADPQPSVAGTATPQVAASPVTEEYVATASGADPFDPLTDSGTSGTTTETTSSGSSSSSSSSSGSKQSTQSSPTTKTQTAPRPVPTYEPAPAPKPAPDKPAAEPEQTAPKLMKDATEEASQVTVKVVEVTGDYVVVKADGKRTKLFLATVGKDELKYVSQLNADCAWIGREGTKLRVSVCKGETEKI